MEAMGFAIAALSDHIRYLANDIEGSVSELKAIIPASGTDQAV